MQNHMCMPNHECLLVQVEMQLGQRVNAALSHRMLADAGEPGTEVRLSFLMSPKVRLLGQLKGLSLVPSLLLQYSSEGMPG